MTNHQSPIKRFPLLPFSQLVYDIPCWWRHVYRFPFTFLWKDGAKEKVRIEKAVRSALTNHPVFQMRTDWRGRQYTAPQNDIVHGPYHDIDILADGDDVIINMTVSRILGDGRSGEILMDDIRRAYNGESLKPDDYWGYLEYIEQQKQLQHYADSKVWLENEFTDDSIPVRPTLDRPLWTLFSPKVGVYQSDYSDLHQSLYSFAKEHVLSLDGFFSLCAALAIAEYCGTDAAALTWAYEGRERPEEQRIFGSLHRDIPFQIKNLKSEIRNHKSDLIREARNQIRSGIAHSDFPYTLTKPFTKRWNYAVNVLRVEDEHELIKLLPQPVEILPSSPQKYAYALLDVEIHESFDHLHIVYRYSATHYKESSIRRFAGLVRKYAEWLLTE
ncbi:MAG: hypothetical protein IJQ32_08270 [Paludibacteraceae bacterium]|nr:hypothetical protein [Paludibacteraceae bacterium]